MRVTARYAWRGPRTAGFGFFWIGGYFLLAIWGEYSTDQEFVFVLVFAYPASFWAGANEECMQEKFYFYEEQ